MRASRLDRRVRKEAAVLVKEGRAALDLKRGLRGKAGDLEVALYDADGVELDDATSPGYVRGDLLEADWAAAVDGMKSAAAVECGTPTDAWVTAVAFALIQADATEAFYGYLADDLVVTGSGDPVSVAVTVQVEDYEEDI